MARSEIIGLALTPLILPVAEVFIRFIRRVLSNKSPFKGDRLHMHYILSNNYGFSPSTASTLISIVNMIGIGIVFSTYFLFRIHSLASLSVGFISIIAVNLIVCGRHWNLKIKENNLFSFTFNAIKKKEVNIISLEKVESFEFKLAIPVNDRESGEQDEKKAA